jgi:hypothetical protein
MRIVTGVGIAVLAVAAVAAAALLTANVTFEITRSPAYE